MSSNPGDEMQTENEAARIEALDAANTGTANDHKRGVALLKAGKRVEAVERLRATAAALPLKADVFVD